jgi:hypothetical protein
MFTDIASKGQGESNSTSFDILMLVREF